MEESVPQLIFLAVVILLTVLDGIARGRRKHQESGATSTVEPEDRVDREGGERLRPGGRRGSESSTAVADAGLPSLMEQLLEAALPKPAGAGGARPTGGGGVVYSPEAARRHPASSPSESPRPVRGERRAGRASPDVGGVDRSVHRSERSAPGSVGGSGASGAAKQVRAILGGTHAELRRAVLLHDILGPPKGLLDDPTDF